MAQQATEGREEAKDPARNPRPLRSKKSDDPKGNELNRIGRDKARPLGDNGFFRELKKMQNTNY